jgi:hypothetical protein
MRQINRAIALVKPRQPFIDWVNSLGGDLPRLTLAQARRDTRAMLIPEPERSQGGRRFIELNFAFIFEDELSVWSRDKTQWPEPRTLSLFGEWFDVEIHDMVFDLGVRVDQFGRD